MTSARPDALSSLSFPAARCWLGVQQERGLRPNTLAAYEQALADYLGFCGRERIDPLLARATEIAHYQEELTSRARAAATIQQRLSVLRQFYAYLIAHGLCASQPVVREVPLSGTAPHPPLSPPPWLPNEAEWLRVVEALRESTLRNRLMFALAYEAALCRRELCALEVSDFDVAQRQVRSGTRRVPYSTTCQQLWWAYLTRRAQLAAPEARLFLSESARNFGRAMSAWAWAKVVQFIAERTGLPRLTTQTLRHLRLVDLAQSGWQAPGLARFAGSSLTTATHYQHLAGLDPTRALAGTEVEIAGWRVQTLARLLEIACARDAGRYEGKDCLDMIALQPHDPISRVVSGQECVP